MAQLLIIDDDAVLAQSIAKALGTRGHQVRALTTGAEALTAFRRDRADVVLVSADLPVALTLVNELHVDDPTAMIIVTARDGTVDEAVEAMKRGASDYMHKPLDLDHLAVEVERSLSSRRMVTELGYLKARDARGADMAGLVGDCDAMKTIFDAILRLGRKTSSRAAPTVLLTGETGTGKGVLARAIHYNGRRRDRPFVEVNCASIPQNLFESELFGAERGAYTGAESARLGYVETAEGGTLFLDEISCLPVTMQAKLLTVLESGRFRRVGSATERQTDFQVIAATNLDLHAATERGAFRADLLHRLEVVVLTIPPLRDRGDDRMMLANRLCEALCCDYGIEQRRFSDDAKRLIEHYQWPGNVRELRNVLEQVLLLEDAAVIQSHHLHLRSQTTRSAAEVSDGAFSLTLPANGVGLAVVEDAVIDHALKVCEGNVSRAARWLKISRDQLRYRLTKRSG